MKIYTNFLKFNNKKMKSLIKKWAKTRTDTSPKKIYRWQTSIWKDVPHHMSLGNCKLKQKWDATTQLFEWPKSKTLTTPKPRENVEQEELSFIAGGNAEWHRYFGRQFGSFLQTKHNSYHKIQQLLLLDICPNKLKTYVHTKARTQIFLAAFS